MTTQELNELKREVERIREAIKLLKPIDDATVRQCITKHLVPINQYLTELFIKASLEKDKDGEYIHAV